MDLSEINRREKEFHNELHILNKKRFESKFYKAAYSLYEDFFNILKTKVQSKDVLDYGCGIGNFAEKVSNFKPKKLVAIDVSEEAIKKAKSETKSGENKIDYRVENCENSNLSSGAFDIIYGSGILHHLNLNKSLKELSRMLKKGGIMLFIEPMATNPIINIYRKLTPKARSADEHPLIFQDIRLIESMFTNVEIKYYGFLTLIFFPFYKSPENSKLFRFISGIDRIILKTKYLRFLAWSVLVKAEKN
jgi:ubiquinone/menaquinone biosynthesis C-methylase UbiE